MSDPEFRFPRARDCVLCSRYKRAFVQGLRCAPEFAYHRTPPPPSRMVRDAIPLASAEKGAPPELEVIGDSDRLWGARAQPLRTITQVFFSPCFPYMCLL